MQIYSSKDQTPRHRYDYWHDLIESSYATCDGATADRRDFDAELRVATLGQAQLTRVATAPIRYTRSARHVRQCDTDDFFISYAIQGEEHIRQNDRTAVHRAGSVLIYDSGRPYDFDMRGDYRALLMRVPRAMVEKRFLASDRIAGTLLDARMPQARLIGNLLGSIMDTAEETDLDMSFATPALDMIAAAFAQSGEAPGAGAGRLTKIQQFILENLAQEELNVAAICAAQNISIRSLNRLFADAGTTPMKWLRERRLAAARAMFTEHPDISVTEVAFRCGFNDLSYFGRCFRKAYGAAPGSLRKG